MLIKLLFQRVLTYTSVHSSTNFTRLILSDYLGKSGGRNFLQIEGDIDNRETSL
jgi:hypothetical protein